MNSRTDDINLDDNVNESESHEEDQRETIPDDSILIWLGEDSEPQVGVGGVFIDIERSIYTLDLIRSKLKLLVYQQQSKGRGMTILK